MTAICGPAQLNRATSSSQQGRALYSLAKQEDWLMPGSHWHTFSTRSTAAAVGALSTVAAAVCVAADACPLLQLTLLPCNHCAADQHGATVMGTMSYRAVLVLYASRMSLLCLACCDCLCYTKCVFSMNSQVASSSTLLPARSLLDPAGMPSTHMAVLHVDVPTLQNSYKIFHHNRIRSSIKLDRRMDRRMVRLAALPLT